MNKIAFLTFFLIKKCIMNNIYGNKCKFLYIVVALIGFYIPSRVKSFYSHFMDKP